MLKIRIPDTHIKEKKYILDVLVYDFWGLKYEYEVDDSLNQYELINGTEKVVLPDIFFANYDDFKSHEPSVEVILTHLETSELAELPAWFVSRDQRSSLQTDVMGMAFFLLTGFADIHFSEKDNHQRDEGDSSFLVRNNLIDRPIIQEWFTVLTHFLFPAEECVTGELLPSYSKHVSHDVDQPFEYLDYSPLRLIKRMAGDLLVRKDIKQSLERVQNYFYVKAGNYDADPYNNFDELLEVLNQYDTQSTFFFVSGKRRSSYDVRYDINHPAVKEVMEKVVAAGHQIGIHPAYNTFRDSELLRNEVQNLAELSNEIDLQDSVTHCRKHYLRWDWEVTPANLSKAGITDDYTLGYADRSGFRAGVAFPYHAFDWKKHEGIELRIHPLIVMECSLFVEKYMGLDMDESEKKVILYHEQLNRLGGEYVLLWHNHLLLEPSELKLFTKFLSL